MTAEKAKELLSKDSYDTPADTYRYLGDRLFFNSRWWFYFLFAGIVIRSNRIAAKGNYDNDQWLSNSFDVMKRIEGCGGRFHIRGLENLRKSNEPVVIISNHMSTLETVVLPAVILPSRPLTFVVKEKLLKGPIFGPVMRAVGPISVGRVNPRDDLREVMSKGKEILENGKSLVIFPQSTRLPGFDPAKFNSLGVKLAGKAGVKVVPLAIKTDFWGDSKLIKGFGPINREKPIYMTFGEPMTVAGNGKAEHQQVVEFIASHLEGWMG
ncbi:MAG: 1-acyl-sn-glycerol-3-phosphate acyltransferase [bacterium]|nr:1-acyl-sn-glycerol-3-phosphate acyltransferase [bacterium]